MAHNARAAHFSAYGKAMTVADVRRLHSCAVCCAMGFHGGGLVQVAAYFKRTKRGAQAKRPVRQFAHPSCYIRATSMANLLALPLPELNTIRLCDVTTEQMRQILNVGQSETKRKANPDGH